MIALPAFRRQAPAWLTWLLVGGLVTVYVGERIFGELTPARIVFSSVGGLLVLGAVVWRLISLRAATGDARYVERLFFFAYVGCLLSLIGFLLAGDGADWIGLDIDEPRSAARFETAATVLAAVLLAISLLPALAAQWAQGAGRPHGERETSAVDRLRFGQLAAAGLTVGMAASFLMLTGWIATRRDKTLDMSYFRTSSPGGAVSQIVESRGTPLRVLLFFPPANEVKDQVLAYFRALGDASENVVVEEFDRLAAPDVAQQHQVTEDGTIVLAYGERSEKITLPVRMREARTRLRAFDADVQRALMRVARDERTIYLTVGHGELNDPTSTGPVEMAPFRSVNALRELFGLLNYRVADLGIQGGLGNEVPSDAAMVVVLGPARSFLEPELQSLDRYLARGGSVLLALEPTSAFRLGPLRQRLGLDFRAERLADDAQFVRQRGNIADHALIVTDRFSSHAAVSTLGRAGVGSAMLLMGAGYLEPVDSTRPPAFVVRSLPSTFADRNGDFEFNDGSETRQSYSLVAAVEVPVAPRPAVGTATPAAGDTTAADTTPAPAAAPASPGRAMVFADAELFSDAVVTSLGLNAALAADAVRWLGREETLGGDTRSEEDVPIVHTRAENVVWFHSTIIGVPALVLGLGLFGVRRRRKAAGRRAEELSARDGEAPELLGAEVTEKETVNR
jgi:hypothetical protein